MYITQGCRGYIVETEVSASPPDPCEDITDNREGGVTHFPIVGIGAVAGGLESFEAFFRACPADTGMGSVPMAVASGRTTHLVGTSLDVTP